MIGVSAVSRTTDSIDLIAWKATQPTTDLTARFTPATWDVNQNDGQWSAFEAISQVGFGSQDTFCACRSRADRRSCRPSDGRPEQGGIALLVGWLMAGLGRRHRGRHCSSQQWLRRGRSVLTCSQWITTQEPSGITSLSSGTDGQVGFSLGVPSPLTEPSSGNAYTSLAGVAPYCGPNRPHVQRHARQCRCHAILLELRRGRYMEHMGAATCRSDFRRPLRWRAPRIRRPHSHPSRRFHFFPLPWRGRPRQYRGL